MIPMIGMPQGLEWLVILAIVSWGDRHYDDGRGPPILRRHKACGCDFQPVMTCSACGDEVEARAVEARPGPAFNPSAAG